MPAVAPGAWPRSPLPSAGRPWRLPFPAQHRRQRPPRRASTALQERLCRTPAGRGRRYAFISLPTTLLSSPGLSRRSRLSGHCLSKRDGRDKPGHDTHYAAFSFFSGALRAPEPLISATSFAENLSTSLRISSVCSPSSGERFTSEIESDSSLGLPTLR